MIIVTLVQIGLAEFHSHGTGKSGRNYYADLKYSEVKFTNLVLFAKVTSSAIPT
jgi:hypothetical protein